jgi:hypothetical protein
LTVFVDDKVDVFDDKGEAVDALDDIGETVEDFDFEDVTVDVFDFETAVDVASGDGNFLTTSGNLNL